MTLTIHFGLAVLLLLAGVASNEVLTRLVGKFYAYVLILVGFGCGLLYLGLTPCNPTLLYVGSGMLGIAFVLVVIRLEAY